ncbi:Spore germination protein YaaH [Pseudobutyrivibrio sp. UC1225]|uniref:glycosyl hydrolase family 18 protein n=1 Tax=Pseudobutyrivibrio sp. UC1225 TaxID=1798185 RepID=UPI0008F31ED1|nr:glycosyl hydrolase family 18 protein [Pseudobutyrivibrio sp. UC1225]SFN73891.1 Spore germination protein YaaH [Pseudobutyrivibrio sp. UC1225]
MSYRKRKRRRGIPRGYVYIAIAVLATVLLVGGIAYVKKYAPTKEHMDLAEYFSVNHDNEAAVVLNGEFQKLEEDSPYGYAIVKDGQPYLEIGFLKDHLDDGFVYDSTEVTLRYATDIEVYTATVGSSDYFIDKSNNSLGHPAVVAQDGTAYVAVDYINLLIGEGNIDYFDNPDRVFVNTYGTKYDIGIVSRKSQIRKLNGPKSPVLEDVKKGDQIYVLRDTGKWSYVFSDNGVCGYIKNRAFEISGNVDYNVGDEREYKHISIGNDISLLWHQVTSQAANGDIANVLANSGNIKVISPTWFHLSDNKGGIASIASSNYVSICHANNVQVWGLVSNLEDASVDTTTVLNTTSARDNLVNNLIAQAITHGLDGINVDIEQLAAEAGDGYIQFIKELSIKCEKNDIILSVDNYVPTASSGVYNRSEQAKYADYVIIMGYDEHYSGSEEAGSVASLGWVDEGVKATLDEVPAEQVILGMPFYCRVWEVKSDGSVSSTAYGMNAIQSYLKTNGISTTWDDSMGQYYGESTKNDVTYKIWVEDETSIEEKLKVMDKYNLAGGAFWKKGFDSTGVWNIIAKYL